MHEASRTLWDKKREYVKKINELGTDSKNKSIRDIYRHK